MFSMLPIGRVACSRTEAIDDDWGEIVSRVMLDSERFTAESRNKRRPNRIGVCTCELMRGYWR